MPGPRAGGIIFAMSLGLTGAVVGGCLGLLMLSHSPSGFNLNSILGAMIGSFYPLIIYRCYALRM
jgi:uncharacterized membrane protein YeaQ/YmgE (transglycosylase-associated protein family)